jgi:uncharacterized membrane protein HdeD (DUF308 family)
MAAVLIGNWWALALRGIAAILFAVLAFAAPVPTATVLMLAFGAYALIDGVFAFLAAQRAAHRHGRSWPLLVEGIVDVIVALAAFVFPGAALIALIYVVAAWAIITGAALVTAGIALSRLNGHLLMICGGALSIVLGIALGMQPGAGVVALAWWLGVYALLFGIIMLAAAFRLRQHSRPW